MSNTAIVKGPYIYDSRNRKLCKIVLGDDGQISLEFPERDAHWRKTVGPPRVDLIELVKVVAASQVAKPGG